LLDRVYQVIPRPFVNITLFALAGVVFVRFIFPYTAPFVLAMVLAAVIDPAVNRLQRRGLHRGVSVLLVLILVFGFVIFAGTNILLRGIAELQEFAFGGASRLMVDLAQFEAWIQSYQALEDSVPPNLFEVIEAGVQDVNDFITDTAKMLLSAVVDTVKDIPRLLIYTLVSFIAAFFISKDKKKIEAGLLRLVPEHKHERIRKIRDGVLTGAMGYVRAQLIIVSITTVIATTSFIILGVPYVGFLAMLIFVMDFIPVIGPSLIFLPFAGWSMVSGLFRQGLFLLLTYGCIAATRQMLEPKLIGDRIGVHPLVTLFALFMGVRLLGVVGFIAAPLIVIVIKVILFTADEMQTGEEPSA